ncbi:hypothetical protein X971_5032 (plasmid) [Agrobacterium tumefaciens LBA4213 (Ach5)]|nr:hypothetical protein X971_5032 [Agrobacterium tumefaciens LBA4213 (Ach5)]
MVQRIGIASVSSEIADLLLAEIVRPCEFLSDPNMPAALI